MRYPPPVSSNPTDHDRDEIRRREALDTLDRLRTDGGTFAASALARATRRAVAHFSARDASGSDAGAADPIELWGRRIGRGLSLIGVLGLAIYLYFSYLR